MNQVIPCSRSLDLPVSGSLDSAYSHVSEDQILDLYATLGEERWSTSRCQPNLTILVFTDQIVRFESGLRHESFWRPQIFARFNHIKQPNQHVVSKVQTLIREVNADNASNTGALKLERFLDRFAQWYANDWNYGAGDGASHRVRHQHTIPMWAAITFGVCSVLSVLAVLVGNLVTSSKVTRRHKNFNGNRSKRKWGAGFSGGMWASV